ncbi:hypothetical protein C8Q78DRAFT_980914 [Trametes maxima]|nr:hypothetical protein C8Q78DRAFT_980914 [Trametes maxima]
MARTHSEFSSLSKGGNQTPVTMKQDEDFWFDDGSIVIVAEDTGFRVHRSLLARVSSVFEDTFSIPQPPDARAYQGVPVLELQDGAHDMKCLLYAIYDGRRYLANMDPHIPFVILSAHIRLGHKYDIPEIVNQAVEYLQTYFTTDFETWIHNENSSDLFLPFDFSERMIADVFETVNLARLIERPNLLPAALYLCCQQEPEDLLLGIPRAGRDDPGQADAVIVRLNDDDVRLCIRAQRTLLRESCDMVGALAREATAKEAGADRCEYPERCANARESMVREILGDFATLVGSDILSERMLPCQFRLCGTCAGELVVRKQSTVREAWRRLPHILGLSALRLDVEMCAYGRGSQYPARPCTPMIAISSI